MKAIKKKYVIGKKATILLSSNINWEREYEKMLLEEIENDREWEKIVSHSLDSVGSKNGYAKIKKRQSDVRAEDRSYTDGSIVFLDTFTRFLPCKGNSLQLFSDKVPIER